MYTAGQALWGKLPFVDGEAPKYPRPFLIVEVKGEYVHLLNVSSINKHRLVKLHFPTNYVLTTYNPPFIKPSFVKVDSLVIKKIDELADMALYNGGSQLNEKDLTAVRDKLLQYLSNDRQEESFR